MSRTSVTGTVSGKTEWEGYTVEYTVRVSGEEYFQKGRMYMPNGDPGYPDEYDSEGPFFEEIDEVNLLDAEGVQVENDDEIYDAHKEVIDLAIQRDVENNKEWDDCSWDYPEPYEPEPPEPEYEKD
jgi:hypothetical protein